MVTGCPEVPIGAYLAGTLKPQQCWSSLHAGTLLERSCALLLVCLLIKHCKDLQPASVHLRSVFMDR